MFRLKNGTERIIEIREINDVRGNNYKIYDVLEYQPKFSYWKSVCTYETLEDALEYNEGAKIVDKTK